MFPNISYQDLVQKHPDRELWEGRWPDYRLAYKGGEMFLRAAGQNTAARANVTSAPATFIAGSPFNVPTRRFLKQLEGEPNEVYNAVWERAYYINWMSAIIDYFRHWLFTQPPNVRPADSKEVPDWYADFFNSCNGAGSTLCDFIRDEFLDVLLLRRGGWLIGKQDAIAQIDVETKRPVLTHYKAEDIYDWQCDITGELEWILLHKTKLTRDFPELRKEVETFTYVDRESWITWQVVKRSNYDEKTAPMECDLIVIGQDDHDLGKVPFVLMEVPHGLWIADKLFSWQIDLFNKWVRLGNAQLLGCIMQPYISSDDPEAQSRIFGEGVLLKLRCGNSVTGQGEEKFGWISPDTKPLEFISSQIDKQKDEGYRIVHQMSLAVDTNAIGAIARSGTSKIEDRKASEVILAAYGGHVRDAIIRTLELVSLVEGDKTKWVCDGFDNFQISSLDEELQIAALASTLNIKSPTFNKQLQIKIANRLLDRIDEKMKEDIASEIEDAVDANPDVPLGGATPPALPTLPPEANDSSSPDKAAPPPSKSGENLDRFQKEAKS